MNRTGGVLKNLSRSIRKQLLNLFDNQKTLHVRVFYINVQGAMY